MSTVKQHTRRSKKGKLYTVSQHERSIETIVKKKVSNRHEAQALLEKYKGRPHNLKLMVDSKWKDETVTRHGKQVKEPRLIATKKEWEAIINENKGLAYKIIKRYNQGGDWEDKVQVATTAIFEAVNKYGAKYNPKEPYDLQKHLSNYIAGYVQAEVAKDYAVAINLPYQQKILYSKFKSLYDRFDGDRDAILKEMDLKKKHLYPSLSKTSPGEAEEPLPREGYVTLVKKDVLDKKTAKHQEKVDKINQEYENELVELERRVTDQEEGTAYDDYKMGVDEFQKLIQSSVNESIKLREKYDKTMSSHQSLVDKVDARIQEEEQKLEADSSYSNKKLVNYSKLKQIYEGKKEAYEKGADFQKLKSLREKVGDLNKRFETYKTSFKPLTEKQIQLERARISSMYQMKLKEAKDEFNKELDKTVIPGADKLFDRFEEVMGFRDLRLTSARSDDEDSGLIEEIVASEELDPENELLLREGYKFRYDSFMDVIDMLDKPHAEVFKMRVGLHDKNKIQPHGLWGYPMDVTEIANKANKALFKRGDQNYKKEVKLWEEAAPEQTRKFKVDPDVFKKETADYKKRRNTAKTMVKKRIDAINKKVEAARKAGKSVDLKKVNAEKNKIRVDIYKKMKARTEDTPTKFITKKMSPKQYKQAVEDWNLSKPYPYYASSSQKRSIVSKVLKEAEGVMRRLVVPGEVAGLMSLHRRMIKHGLKKSMQFGDILTTLDLVSPL